jgi:nitroreductase
MTVPELAFLRTLRQTRAFTDQRVPDEVLTDLLEVARWTGSAKNTQPWEFLVVRDKETLAAIAEFGQFSKFLRGVDVAIVLILNGTSPRSEAYDEGRVSERLMLAAKAVGLGSGTAWWGDVEAQAKTKAFLGIPEEKIVVSAVGFGYPAPRDIRPGVPPGRKPLAELVHNERYGNR